jgi:thiol-disulfide isomerase/thioredoxin
MVPVIALALVVLMAIALQGWLILQLRGQTTRLQARLDLVTRRAASAIPSPGTPAPAFDLPTLDDTRASLERLLAGGKPLMLHFTAPRCGPCYELLPDIGGWQRLYGDRLTIAVVSGGTPEANRAMTAEYGIAPGSVLVQEDREIADAYAARMAPAAVVIRPDGRLSGEPVYGARAVRQLVADTLGLAMPEAPARTVQTVGVGEQVPALRRPDLDANPFDLGSLRGAPTLLLFWSPGCSHCQELLPDMRAWEANLNGLRMLIVSGGPVALNKAAGLRSQFVLDDDRGIAGRFGATGTPAAVLIDEMGIVASDVARGTRGVRALVAQRLAAASPAAD